MTGTASLLAEIESFLAETGMKKTVFGRAALNDGAFVKRLQDGADVTLGTADRVRAYIGAQRAKAAPKRRRSAAEQRATP